MGDAGADDPGSPGERFLGSPATQEAPAGRAFLTSLKQGGDRGGDGGGGGMAQQRRGKERTLVLESVPGAGPRILEIHDDLRRLAETLDEKVSGMLKEHEKDFFLAYKTHMYDVQKKFKALKQKADEEETKTRKDTKIQSLEKELEWFMTEALRLDELCKGYKKEVDKWKAKAEALDEDRRFLEDQIKGAKRQNKVLRAAVERAQSSAYSALMMNRAAAENGEAAGAAGRRSNNGPSPTHPGSPQQRPESHTGGGVGLPSLNNHRGGPSEGRLTAPPGGGAVADGGGAMYSSGGHSAAERGGAGYPGDSYPSSQVMPAGGFGGQSPSGLLQEGEQRFIDTIRHLKESLEKEQRNVRMLKAARANTYTKKSELEEFFLKCIDEARKDVMRKKHQTAPGQKSKKEKVLDVLLSSEDVLVFLYEKLFPHRTGMAQHMASPGGENAAGGLLSLQG